MKLNKLKITLIICILLLGFFLIRQNRYQQNIQKAVITIGPKFNIIKKEIKIIAPLPSEALINVPFICQAPFGNWSIHEDACEEAAILMNHAYLERAKLTLEYADQELLNMRKWQREHYGYEKDLSCTEAAKFIHDYYGYKHIKIFNNIESLDIKREISNNNLVIVPVMTHSLLNPHYGPRNVYHFVLIKGYTPEGVITNDAGVKEGEGYFYPWEVIFSAIDSQKEKMNQGRVMLVINK